MGDETPVPNFRGGHGRTLEYLIGPGLPLLILIGTIIWGISQFAKKDSVDALRDDVWRLRMDSQSTAKDVSQVKDTVGDLKNTLNEVKLRLAPVPSATPRRDR